MKRLKKIVMLGAMVLVIGAVSLTAFAATYNTPAEAIAGLTDQEVENVIAEREETGKTYGAMAVEAEKLEEFKAEVLQIKKDTIDKRVADGTITQERADEILAALEENQANCDGTGSRMGQKMGVGFGRMNGNGKGLGQGQGQGFNGGSCRGN